MFPLSEHTKTRLWAALPVVMIGGLALWAGYALCMPDVGTAAFCACMAFIGWCGATLHFSRFEIEPYRAILVFAFTGTLICISDTFGLGWSIVICCLYTLARYISGMPTQAD